jgi:catechol 2,3-dioxygenase-like lactoylglutathione lyase family enzyme
MDLTIHASFLPHTDPDASLAFYRDTLGLQVRNDIGYGGMCWITIDPPDQPGTSIVPEPPFAPGCGVTDEERRIIVEMMWPRAPRLDPAGHRRSGRRLRAAAGWRCPG